MPRLPNGLISFFKASEEIYKYISVVFKDECPRAYRCRDLSEVVPSI